MATILVVDDQRTNRDLLTKPLAYRGHRLIEAGNGEEALRVARAEKPDLVITDIVIPAVDGYELVRQLRGDPVLERTRIVFCTAAYVESEAHNLARNLGVSHVLVKPCGPEAIVKTVDEALGCTAAPRPAGLAELSSERFHREHLSVLTHKMFERVTDLEHVNASLEERIADRTRRLEDANEALARIAADRERSMAELQRVNESLAASVKEMEERSGGIALLAEMDGMLQTCIAIEEAYEVFGHFAPQLFQHLAGSLYSVQGSRRMEEVLGWGNTPAHARSFATEDCWALRRGRSHFVGCSQTAALCRHLAQPTPKRYLCIPLQAQGVTTGLLHLRSVPGPMHSEPLSEAEQRLAAAVADTLALSLANLRLRERLHQESIRDPLTGLYNRRYLEESLQQEVRRAIRGGFPIGIVLADIDHFKQFNDQFGHEAGDTVLRIFGNHVLARTRGGDIACRYGGEEFLIVLPGAPSEATLQRAERLRADTEALLLEHEGRSLGPVTVSVGVASFPGHGSSMEALVRVADTALYHAKEAGGNRVVASCDAQVQGDAAQNTSRDVAEVKVQHG